MLDTGIDIPEVVNLVFIKLVRSRPHSGRWWGVASGCVRTYVILSGAGGGT